MQLHENNGEAAEGVRVRGLLRAAEGVRVLGSCRGSALEQRRRSGAVFCSSPKPLSTLRRWL